MKALTIWQPWASLIMVGAKPFEFRPKSYLRYPGHPAVGELIVIHASARPVKPDEVEDLLAALGHSADHTALEPVSARTLLKRCRAAHKYQALPLGCGLGTVALGTPRNASTLFRGAVADSNRAAADESAYNWAWPINDVRPFDAPIPMRGAQGFWNWPERAEA
jgi:hypothetical protein